MNWIAPSAVIQAPCPLVAHRTSVRSAQAFIEPKPGIEPKALAETKALTEPHRYGARIFPDQSTSQAKSPRRQDAAPFPARQRDEAVACLNRAVITGYPRCKQRCRNMARVRHHAYMQLRT